MSKLIRLGLALAAAGLVAPAARAGFVHVTVTVENLAPANGVSFAPLRLGFNNGTFDAFDNGQPATAPIISVAEGGSGSDWFPAFAAAEPNATLGSVGGGPLQPGQRASETFTVDAAANPFFTFGAMVVPSNDLFLGNDSPTRYRLLDDAGELLITGITQRGRDIWDAGSEAVDPANAAFVVGGVNDNRTPQNGVVSFSFAELAVFDGLTTGGGYVYDHSLLTADAAVYRITFQATPVPAPPTVLMVAVGSAGFAAAARLRRRWTPVEA